MAGREKRVQRAKPLWGIGGCSSASIIHHLLFLRNCMHRFHIIHVARICPDRFLTRKGGERLE